MANIGPTIWGKHICQQKQHKIVHTFTQEPQTNYTNIGLKDVPYSRSIRVNWPNLRRTKSVEISSLDHLCKRNT